MSLVDQFTCKDEESKMVSFGGDVMLSDGGVVSSNITANCSEGVPLVYDRIIK